MALTRYGATLPMENETTIPNWASRDLRTGTVRAIVRELGIGKESLEQI